MSNSAVCIALDADKVACNDVSPVGLICYQLSVEDDELDILSWSSYSGSSDLENGCSSFFCPSACLVCFL